MPMPTGTSIGPYEIVGWLGAGGMGEVYRAYDSRLGRAVAIKLIPETFARDTTRLHRFEQEARAAGQLNHPNIIAVYDVGTHDGAPYIVSELLEGESLRTRLQGVALPSPKAVDYARQIAEGLAAAHDKGIVHRDLKPDNVFLTNDGRIKILDFGIAKLTVPADDSVRPTGFPTETAEGMVLGTPGYMSPEQVRGEAVDARSDLFSFGAILYEMLTGRTAFVRATAPETVAAILKEDPPVPLSENIPPALARIVSRCLEKTREARFQSARDLAFGLEFLSGESAAAASAPVSVGRAVWLRHPALPWVLAAGLTVALVGTAVWSLRPVTPLILTKLDLQLQPNQRLDGSGGAHTLALSPDGMHMAFVATPDRLYLRSMSDREIRAIPGTEAYLSVREPVFSPEGDEIAFYAFSDKELKKMPLKGGAAVTICKAETPFGMSWGRGGIVFGQARKGIMRVSPNGGDPELLVPAREGEVLHGPEVLPDGAHVLFTVATGTARDRWENAHIVVQSLQSGGSGNRKELGIVGTDARYIPTGYLVYAQGGSLYAVKFDEKALTVKGSGVQVVPGVSRAAGQFTGAAQFSFSRTGTLVYVPAPVMAFSASLDIAKMTPNGDVEPLNLPPAPYAWPRASPDGSRVAFGKDDGKDATVWVSDLVGKSVPQSLTSGSFPTWADNNHIAFQSDRGDDHGIWWQLADGTEPAKRLTTPDRGTAHVPESWSPNGETLLFSITKGLDVSLWTVSLRDMERRPFGNVHSSNPTNAVFSPDGRWVAYSSTERGKETIYVAPFPYTGISHPLQANGSDIPHYPRWSPDSKELFYDPRTSGFEFVIVTTQPTFGFGNAVSVPKKILLGPPSTRTPYDITRDGRLLGLITSGQKEYVRGSADQVQVVLSWFDELQKLVPLR